MDGQHLPYLKGPYSFFLDQGAISLDLPWDLAQEEAVFPGRAMNSVEGSFERHKPPPFHAVPPAHNWVLLWWVPLLRMGGNCHGAVREVPAGRRGLGYGVYFLGGRKEGRRLSKENRLCSCCGN